MTSSVGNAIDALKFHVEGVNQASARVRAVGLSVQLSINGHDYGDRVSLRLEGEWVDGCSPQPTEPERQ